MAGIVIANIISISRTEITEEMLIQSVLLLEDDFFILQENDDYILLEAGNG